MSDGRAEMFGGPKDGLRVDVGEIPRVLFPTLCPKPEGHDPACAGIAYAIYRRDTPGRYVFDGYETETREALA